MVQSRSAFQWGFGALLVAAVVPGCGGSSSSSVAQNDFAQRLAKLICDRLVGCCQAAALPFSPATCNSKATAYFQASFDDQDPSRVHYDGSAADGCLAAYDRALTGCTYDDSQQEALNAACNSLFVGLVPLGGACHKGIECAPQAGKFVSCTLIDSGASSSEEGTCTLDSKASPAAAPHGKQGEACVGTCSDSACETGFPSVSGATTTTICFAIEGLYCDTRSSCQPVLADGQACTYSECKATSYCAEDKSCTAKKPDGATCSGSSECMTSRCHYVDGGDANAAGTCGPSNLADAKTCAGNFE